MQRYIRLSLLLKEFDLVKHPSATAASKHVAPRIAPFRPLAIHHREGLFCFPTSLITLGTQQESPTTEDDKNVPSYPFNYSPCVSQNTLVERPSHRVLGAKKKVLTIPPWMANTRRVFRGLRDPSRRSNLTMTSRFPIVLSQWFGWDSALLQERAPTNCSQSF